MSAPRTDDPYLIEKRRVRAQFERAAAAYETLARVQREVEERLLEHLDVIRLSPRRVLDVGAGPGNLTRVLSRRFRHVEVVALDIAPGMLRVARGRAPRLFGRQRFVCGDMEALPLADAGFELVVSNASLQWATDLDRTLAELGRVLRPGGLLLFSTFGPDTLRELRESWRIADPHVHVHAFMDMHDIGDALVRAGFADVVMDVERVDAAYADLGDLLAELKGLGVTNASRGRPRGLTGRRRLARMREAYERHRRADGLLPATYEAVFAHAWRPGPRASVSVPFNPAGARRAPF